MSRLEFGTDSGGNMTVRTVPDLDQQAPRLAKVTRVRIVVTVTCRCGKQQDHYLAARWQDHNAVAFRFECGACGFQQTFGT